jgi:hypothetical protein
MRVPVTTRLVLCLVVLAGIVLPEVAAAQCFGQCVIVAPPFCRRCMDAEQPTGVLCRNSGSCGCFFVQCAAAAEQSEVQATLSDLGLGAPTVVPTSCLSAASAEVAPPLLAAAD